MVRFNQGSVHPGIVSTMCRFDHVSFHKRKTSTMVRGNQGSFQKGIVSTKCRFDHGSSKHLIASARDTFDRGFDQGSFRPGVVSERDRFSQMSFRTAGRFDNGSLHPGTVSTGCLFDHGSFRTGFVSNTFFFLENVSKHPDVFQIRDGFSQ